MKRLLSLLAAFAVTQAITFADAPYGTIEHADLKKAIAEKRVVLLDVNGTESWQEGHIPGALDFDAVEKDLAKVLPADKDTLVVAYCGNERCTAYKAGAAAAVKLGYRNVKHYPKGIVGWKKSGEKVETGS